MRSIGKTDNHEHIIAMGPEEYEVFKELCFAVEGSDIFDVEMANRMRPAFNTDLTKVFDAIQQFSRHLLTINTMKKLVEQTEAALLRQPRHQGEDPEEKPRSLL